ncbi:hypothetical protein QL285_067961 [Trifolium repens]|nr:hypothetical protein QL285_067961 [Trifolium repens]
MFVAKRVLIDLGSMQFIVESFRASNTDITLFVMSFFDVFKRARVSVKKEAPVNFLTDPLEGRSTLRSADILVYGWVGGKHTCVDLTGVSPLVGQAALRAASSKVAKHQRVCSNNQHAFIPFAFDTFGFLAPDAVNILKRVQRVMHSNVVSPRFLDSI